MFDEKKSVEMIENFGSHYNYDVDYIKRMIKQAPNAYEKFESFLPMASYYEKAPDEVIFLVKLAVMKNEDCGACLQLNVNMAIEAGVDEQIVKEIVFNKGRNLPEELKELYEFILNVAKNESIDDKLYSKISNKYGHEIMIEIALASASAKVFPTIKRVLGDIESCSVIQIKV